MPALDGLRILDLTQYEAGTSGTQLLAWLGADVVKIESPSGGDPGRHLEPGDGNCLYFLSHNANKRSVTLDLRRPRGRELFFELIKRFDAVTENFTAGTMERLGLGYDALRAVNPAIIYGSVTGFGLTGPYAAYKAYDMIAQATGGSMSVTGEPDGPPVRPGPMFGDTGAGIVLALTLLAAYIQRLRTGEGQRLDLSMQETTATFMRTSLSFSERTGHPVPRTGNRGLAPSALYPCAPGGPNDYVYFVILTSAMWDAFCTALGRPELTVDERFAGVEARRAHGPELFEEVAAWTRQRTKFEAMELMAAAGVPAGAVFDTHDLLNHPHIRAREAVTSVDHPTRGRQQLLSPPFHLSASQVPVLPAPLLGQHTAEVLAQELDLDATALAELAELGVTAYQARATTPR